LHHFAIRFLRTACLVYQAVFLLRTFAETVIRYYSYCTYATPVWKFCFWICSIINACISDISNSPVSNMILKDKLIRSSLVLFSLTL